MTVIDKLKAESLRLRRDKSPVGPSVQYVLSEIVKIGKNNGNRETTEDEAIKVIRNTLNVLQSNYALASPVAKEAINEEMAVLKSVLPSMVSEEEIRNFLSSETEISNKGAVMKAIKAKYGSLVDMRKVSEILAEQFDM